LPVRPRPDIVESVFHAGTETQVTFPSATPDPDNGIYPDDVVKVTVTGKLHYDAANIAGSSSVGTPDANDTRPYSSTESASMPPSSPFVVLEQAVRPARRVA
jgi:hypothetical protein